MVTFWSGLWAKTGAAIAAKGRVRTVRLFIARGFRWSASGAWRRSHYIGRGAGADGAGSFANPDPFGWGGRLDRVSWRNVVDVAAAIGGGVRNLVFANPDPFVDLGKRSCCASPSGPLMRVT